MDCILFRHGIAVDPGEWGGPDAQRPLTAKGIEKTRAAAVGLRNLGIKPTHLLSSSLVRALETAKIIQDMFRFHEEAKKCKELMPGAPPEQATVLLASLPQDACVICVGHEPHLGHTAGFLVCGAPVPGLSLKKAGACCIRFDEVAKPGEGLLRWWLMPSQLRALGH
jgi:phosphohistidine phosphatase